ncbi:methionyl-tRNA formyltransferase [Candidatus Marinamargulisbacteria bacterium SCGC AG-439-L15]|nr:methionyl-tRNA formyltransferase [Candidatus Marinamargulisbacteria bacterium SCGC AG-439-L15]
MKDKHIVFMGTPDFSVPTLKAIHSAFPTTKLSVVSKPDKRRGRGSETSPCPVKKWAEEHTLEVYTPETKQALSELVETLQPDLIIIIAYGMILPKDITDAFLCINIHASLLPKYRGPSPIHAALLNGDGETGVTLMCINEKMDAGDILTKVSVPIQDTDTFGSLHDSLSELGAKHLVEFLGTQPLNSLIRHPQDETQASYCALIQKEDSIIDWDLSPQDMLNRIRAFSPLPGATLTHHGKKIKILEAKIEDGKVHFITVKPEGKAAMSYQDYCLGHPEGLYHVE